ncbi:expressed unknown protein [Seminavis robusta]|uniref:Uncharacterized protein n=1 Tax=Seminavis robusta TaxID=568900 RepID=A0A9N8F0Z7_9STRA|nr:expressed unknown protein [Seminavis robusta]|eukprot:Sro2281_g321810.1 n/a (735) ;mRNA; r:7308-9609
MVSLQQANSFKMLDDVSSTLFGVDSSTLFGLDSSSSTTGIGRTRGVQRSSSGNSGRTRGVRRTKSWVFRKTTGRDFSAAAHAAADAPTNIFASDMVSLDFVSTRLDEIKSDKSIRRLEIEDLIISSHRAKLMGKVTKLLFAGDREWGSISFVDSIPWDQFTWWRGRKSTVMAAFEGTKKTATRNKITFQANVEVSSGLALKDLSSFLRDIKGQQGICNVTFAGALFGYSEGSMLEALDSVVSGDDTLSEMVTIKISYGWKAEPDSSKLLDACIRDIEELKGFRETSNRTGAQLRRASSTGATLAQMRDSLRKHKDTAPRPALKRNSSARSCGSTRSKSPVPSRTKAMGSSARSKSISPLRRNRTTGNADIGKHKMSMAISKDIQLPKLRRNRSAGTLNDKCVEIHERRAKRESRRAGERKTKSKSDPSLKVFNNESDNKLPVVKRATLTVVNPCTKAKRSISEPSLDHYSGDTESTAEGKDESGRTSDATTAASTDSDTEEGSSRSRDNCAEGEDDSEHGTVDGPDFQWTKHAKESSKRGKEALGASNVIRSSNETAKDPVDVSHAPLEYFDWKLGKPVAIPRSKSAGSLKQRAKQTGSADSNVEPQTHLLASQSVGTLKSGLAKQSQASQRKEEFTRKSSESMVSPMLVRNGGMKSNSSSSLIAVIESAKKQSNTSSDTKRSGAARSLMKSVDSANRSPTRKKCSSPNKEKGRGGRAASRGMTAQSKRLSGES